MKNLWRFRVPAIVMAIALGLVGTGGALGQSLSITVQKQGYQINFPDDVVFTLEFTTENTVQSVRLSTLIIGRDASRREPGTFEQEGSSVKAEFILKTRGGSESTFIPPGAQVSHHWIIEDTEGNSTETPKVEFVYMDTRFEWETVSEDMVTVHYYGPTRTRAETILDAAIESLERMGNILETGLTRPVNLVVYNNPLQMQAALPFVSQTTQSGLVTLGQAYSREAVLVLMGFTSDIRGTTSHEVTHLLVAQAAEGPGRRVPDWINEGLAEYANLEPSFSYEDALRYSIRTNRLLPITGMTNQPGTPEDVLLFYGQSRSIVQFMIDTYGSEKMAELLKVFKSGNGNIDQALQEVYGFDRVGLDNAWRQSLGLSPLPRNGQQSENPTPTPIPTRVPLGAPTPVPAISPTPPTGLRADITGDARVDSADLDVLRAAYGRSRGDEEFEASADLNGDGKVNYIDLAILGSQYSR